MQIVGLKSGICYLLSVIATTRNDCRDCVDAVQTIFGREFRACSLPYAAAKTSKLLILGTKRLCLIQ